MGRMLMALQELSLSHAEAAFRRHFIPGTDHAFEPSLRDGASLPLYPGTPGYYRGVPPGQKPSAIQPGFTPEAQLVALILFAFTIVVVRVLGYGWGPITGMGGSFARTTWKRPRTGTM